MLHTTIYISPIGNLLLKANADALLAVEAMNEGESVETNAGNSVVLQNTVQQLDEYFTGKRQIFNLPLAPEGTVFQQQIWKGLLDVPYGKTTSYADFNQQVTQNPLTIRATASANGKNPIGIIIPCHRVIGSNGSLTGYAWGVWRKKWLLDHEQKFAPSGQLGLF